jgi:hypothetical protein
LLNDREPIIVVRNILLIMILSTIKDSRQAAEIALHFWYSAFAPAGHKIVLGNILLQIAENIHHDSFAMTLGERIVMTGALSMRTKFTLASVTKSDLSIVDANSELRRVRFVP